MVEYTTSIQVQELTSVYCAVIYIDEYKQIFPLLPTTDSLADGNAECLGKGGVEEDVTLTQYLMYLRMRHRTKQRYTVKPNFIPDLA